MATVEGTPISEKWEGDHLFRVDVAKFLTTYLNSIYHENNSDLSAGHFVLNLNASWGQGKTFLLTKWAEDLKQARYPVVTFDAWKNDFSKDPLVGFIVELENALSPWLEYVAPAKALMGDVMKTAKQLIGITTRILAGPLAGSIVENLTGLEGLSTPVADKVGDLAEKALEQHKETKRLIEEFKINLRRLIEEIEKQQKNNPECDVQLPLYIFVDELDRCRPTYAIELLENIKHLFGVKGVFFVVATNKEQLCHSIRAVYGSDFDSSAYLGRFFDQEYTLPDPDNVRFANHLFAKYKLEEEDHLFVSMKKNYQVKGNHLALVFAIFSEAFDLSLRDQEQTMHRLKAILSVYSKNPIYFDYLVFLLMLRKCSESLFYQLSEGPADWAEFEPLLRKIFRDTAVEVAKTTLHGHEVGILQNKLTFLIKVYSMFAKKDLRAIQKGANSFQEGLIIEALVYQEAMKNQSPTGKPSLAKYPMLVKQAGQLS